MKSRRSNNKNNKNNSKKSFRGGRTSIVSPEIRYTKGTNIPIKLTCTKCNGISFIVKTLTMGTKTKSFFGMEILDNRFKVFQCIACGFAQMFSNEITCNGKDCDTNLF